MNEVHDADRAFPSIQQGGGLPPGLTMRDWFAGLALANNWTHDQIPDDVALGAYQIADQMLKVREEKS